jgi:hypothetical protein
LWGKGKWVPLPITISVTLVKDSTKTISNSSDFAVFSGDVKGATGTDRDTPAMGSGFLSRWNGCLHHIACLKAVDERGLFRCGPWEAAFIHQTHLPTSMAVGRDEQRGDVSDLELEGGRLSYTGRVTPMGLGKSSDTSVILGESA